MARAQWGATDGATEWAGSKELHTLIPNFYTVDPDHLTYPHYNRDLAQNQHPDLLCEEVLD